MLSQRLTMAALAAERDPSHAATVTAVLGEWGAAHHRLSSGTGLANAGLRNSPAVQTAFASIAEPFAAMQRAALPPIGTDALLRAQEAFLSGMERIVALYRTEAETRVQRLINLELSLCVLLILVLIAEALLVFRPAVARLRAAIHERERLREREFENRELQVAADTARAIGQDLHDGLGQTLTALSFQAKALERVAGEPAKTLSSGIGEAIAQCRAQARRLAPLEIQAAGLEAAVRELCTATGVATGIACHLEWQAPGPPAATHGEFFRIVQEALTNAVRHSRGRKITVLIGASTLTVRDDGQGAVGVVEGVGLRSLRARAARLGADLTCGPLPGGGWAVRLVLR
jgi:signal transduction histidine kinase